MSAETSSNSGTSPETTRVTPHSLIAATPNILRASQKDDYYICNISSNLTNVLQFLLRFHTLQPQRHQLHVKYKEHIQALSKILYYGLTSVIGSGQSLGEEYCDLIQVNRDFLPVSRRRKLTELLLVVFAPFLFRGVQSVASRSSSSSKHFFAALKNLGSYYSYVHLAIFYIRGTYYHISKRLLGIRYLQVRKLYPGEKVTGGYEVLGWLAILQIIILTYVTLRKPLQPEEKRDDISGEASHTEESEDGEYEDIPQTQKCTLCLEKRKTPTSTPCGHLFCWYCIAEWCQTKQECPLCRQAIKPSSLIPCAR